jgi:hypothetical protein
MHHANYRTAVLVLSAIGSHAGHETGDYLVQRDCDAQRKQQRTPEGRRSLARHAATYALTQAATRAGFYRAAGLRVPALAQLAGAVTEGALHAVIDDGRLLAAFAEATGKRRFHDLADHGINGRALMDQAAHKGVQIPVGAVVTTAAAVLSRKGR